MGADVSGHDCMNVQKRVQIETGGKKDTQKERERQSKGVGEGRGEQGRAQGETTNDYALRCETEGASKGGLATSRGGGRDTGRPRNGGQQEEGPESASDRGGFAQGVQGTHRGREAGGEGTDKGAETRTKEGKGESE